MAPTEEFDAADQDGSELHYYLKKVELATPLFPPQAFPPPSRQTKHALPHDWPRQINHLTLFVPDVPRSIDTYVHQVRTRLHLPEMCFLPGCLVDRFSSALSLPPLPPSTSSSAWSAPSSFRDRHFDTRRSPISQRAGDAAFPAPIHRVAAERARAGGLSAGAKCIPQRTLHL
ncbi:hypothetical protein B0H14DRAFT_3782511 [Mycena olivaceomarginata]|nr:hypothetical protein B0H14DRAFT_3782511 [Mycena olivaceomarginata]